MVVQSFGLVVTTFFALRRYVLYFFASLITCSSLLKILASTGGAEFNLFCFLCFIHFISIFLKSQMNQSAGG